MCAEHWNWDTWTGEGEEDYSGEEEEYDREGYNASQPHCEDEGFIVRFFFSLESRVIFVDSEEKHFTLLIRRPPVE